MSTKNPMKAARSARFPASRCARASSISGGEISFRLNTDSAVRDLRRMCRGAAHGSIGPPTEIATSNTVSEEGANCGEDECALQHIAFLVGVEERSLIIAGLRTGTVRFYSAVHPPSIRISVPVMNPAASEHK